MGDGPIKPIRPVGAVSGVREVGPRRRPSWGQLKRWLDFARRKAKERLKRP